MNRIALAAVAALLAAPVTGACAPSKAAKPIAGKPGAPVAIEARLGEGTATVTVRFERAGKNVRVQVSGLEGLTVTSDPSPLKLAAVAQGEIATFDVAFTPGPGRSLLSVAVAGNFGAGRRASAMSFPVGEKSAAQRKGEGAVVEGPGGERVKVLPSGD